MRKSLGIVIVALVACAGLTMAAQPKLTSQPAGNVPAVPLLPPPGDPVNLILDDGTIDTNIGLNDQGAGTASMFEWFNRFSPTEFPLEVARIDIYWDSASAAVAGGEEIELVVYEGDDTPCLAGGTAIVGGQSDNIVNFDMFDEYTLTAPAQVAVGPSVSLAVIDRWIESGVTASMFPAAQDTGFSEGRSYVTWWTAGDPPTPPVLPGDEGCAIIDDFGLPGNWMIRGAGTVVPVELQHLSID